MIELGLALIAACLPSLQFLCRRVSLQSLVRSVRSVVSLSSLRSRSNGSENGKNNTQEATANSHKPYVDVEAVGEMKLAQTHNVEAGET